MSNSRKIYFPGLIFLFSLLANFVHSLPVMAGLSGLTFLKIAPGGRGTAMGEAFTAVAGDLSATYWNPAGAAGLTHYHFLFLQNFFIRDVDFSYLAVGYGKKNISYGITLSLSNVSGLEWRDERPTSEPLGTFELNDAALSLFWAKQIRPQLFSIGISGKILYEKIDLYDDFGWALDLGTTYQVKKNVNLGFAYINLGPKLKLRAEPIRLPQRLTLGCSYRWNRLLGTLDLVKPNDAALKIHTGIEASLDPRLYLRGGWQFGYDEKNLSLGLGIQLQQYQVAYAFVPFRSGLGATHRISLEVSL